MTLSDLNIGLTNLLKDYVKDTSHNETGTLYNSIRFECTDSNGLEIKLNAVEYIQYLDDGDFLKNFFELDSVGDLIAEYLTVILDITLE